MISPVSISRFGTESARAPSVRTRLRLVSKVSVPVASARISTSPTHTVCASGFLESGSPCSAPLYVTWERQFGCAWSTRRRDSKCCPSSAKYRVLAEHCVVAADVHGVVGPVGDRHHRQPRGIGYDEFDVVGVGSAAGLVDDDDRLPEFTDADLQVAVGGGALARSGHADLDR